MSLPFMTAVFEEEPDAPPRALHSVTVSHEGRAPDTRYGREAADMFWATVSTPFATQGTGIVRYVALKGRPTPPVVINADTLAAFAALSVEAVCADWRASYDNLPGGPRHLYRQIQDVENALVGVSAVGYAIHDRSGGRLPRSPEGLLSPRWALVSPRRSILPVSAQPSLSTLSRDKRGWLGAPAGSRWWGATWDHLDLRLLFLQLQPTARLHSLFPTHKEAQLAPPSDVVDTFDVYFGRRTPGPDPLLATSAQLDSALHPDVFGRPWLDVPLTATALDPDAPLAKRVESRLRQEAAAFLYARAAMLVGLVSRGDGGVWAGFHNLIVTLSGIYFTLDARIPAHVVAPTLQRLDFSPYSRPVPPHVAVGASWGDMISVHDEFVEQRVQIGTVPEWPEVCTFCGRIAPSASDLQVHLTEVHGVQ